MPISILRKAPRPREPDPVPVLGALALPAPGPLIDPVAAWSAAVAGAKGGANGSDSHASANGVSRPVPVPNPAPGPDDYVHVHPNNSHRANGLHPDANRQTRDTHSAHRQSMPRATTPSGRNRAPSLVRDPASGKSPDFHRPFAPAQVVPVPALPAAARRARAARKVVRLTTLVAGPSGAGKTSFIDALTGVLDPAAPRLSLRLGPTTNVVRHEVVAADDHISRRIIMLDTPGLPPAGTVATATRNRALNSLLAIVEGRLARTLSEETKVVRKKSDGGELVHLVIYIIDARTVLAPAPPAEVDWEHVHEPPANEKGVPGTRPESELEPDETAVEARLPVDDIEAMRRFCARANVLPVLTHADALTTNELTAVREAVRRDMSTVFGRDPLGQWGILTGLADVDDDDEDAMTTVSQAMSAMSLPGDPIEVPYAVFAPEPGPGFTRAFRWGRADAADTKHSDLLGVRDAVIGAAQWLRTSTREVVYERFRTERLLERRNTRHRAQGSI